MGDAQWLDLERQVREQALAELQAAQESPPGLGEHIAWVNCLFGRTDGLSPVHRVGKPIHSDVYTTCGELIPHPVRWLRLSPALIRRMTRCRHCDAEHIRLVRETAA